MFWLFGALLLFTFFAFISCVVNLYALIAFVPVNRFDRATNYGLLFTISFVLFLALIFVGDAFIDEYLVQSYGAFTAVALAALRVRQKLRNKKSSKNPKQLAAIFAVFIVAGMLGIGVASLIYHALGYMFFKGLGF